jgi:hypothetical protein
VTADPSQRIAEDRALGFELRRIVDVLPRAAAAAPERTATRFDAQRSAPQDLVDLAAQEAPTTFDDPHPQAITRRGERNEDRQAVRRPADTIAVRRQSIDLDFDRLR